MALPAAAIAAMAIGSAAGSHLGSVQSSEKSIGHSKYQLDYQRDLANTAHQRQMADMRRAGLNPILSAKFGGAGNVSPTGTQIPDFGKSAQVGINAAQTMAAVQQKDAQTKQLTAQTGLTNAATKTEEERARLVGAQAGLTESQQLLTDIQRQLQEYNIPKGQAGEMFWDALGAAVHGVTTAKDVAQALKSVREAFQRFGTRKGKGGNRKGPLRIPITKDRSSVGKTGR